MRLQKEELSIIKSILNSYSLNSEIYLHGSRLDDELKGGDIDLFWILPDKDYSSLEEIKYQVVAKLSASLREQKVDLILIKKDETNSHQFFQDSKKEKI